MAGMTTLNVESSTDFTSQTLSGIDEIVFGTINDFVQAIFSAGQFDGIQIAADAHFDSGPSNNYVLVQVGGGRRIDASQWTFSQWTDSVYSGIGDHVLLEGSIRDDVIVGSRRNDEINGQEGSDVIRAGQGDDLISVGILGGNDIIYGGNGIDLLNINRVLVSTGLTIDISKGGLSADIGDGTRIDGVERLVITSGTGNDVLIGGALTDRVEANAGDDFLNGRGGENHMFGMTGNDIVVGSGSDGEFSGGDDEDTLVLKRSNATEAYVLDLTLEGPTTLADGNSVFSDFEHLIFRGGSGGDIITGAALENTLAGGVGADALTGGNAADTLRGNSGNDRLSGGLDGDTLIGGAGIDTFVYTAVDQSNGVALDTIADFDSGDIIDLSAIDAVAGDADDGFTFIGSEAFNNVPGELRMTVKVRVTLIEADTTGDGTADLTIILGNGFAPGFDNFIL